MEQSILKRIKKNLGLDPDYTAFDDDVITHINSAFSTLHHLGLGPSNGFMIEDDGPVWSEFLNDDMRLNSVITYITLKVRLIFDPPATSFTITAIKEEIEQLEWRLNVVREGDEWTDPDPPPEVTDE